MERVQRRHRAVIAKRFEAAVEANLDQSVNIPDLARSIGASGRMPQPNSIDWQKYIFRPLLKHLVQAGDQRIGVAVLPGIVRCCSTPYPDNCTAIRTAQSCSGATRWLTIRTPWPVLANRRPSRPMTTASVSAVETFGRLVQHEERRGAEVGAGERSSRRRSPPERRQPSSPSQVSSASGKCAHAVVERSVVQRGPEFGFGGGRVGEKQVVADRAGKQAGVLRRVGETAPQRGPDRALGAAPSRRPRRVSSSVVLPQPDGPVMPTTRPGSSRAPSPGSSIADPIGDAGRDAVGGAASMASSRASASPSRPAQQPAAQLRADRVD